MEDTKILKDTEQDKDEAKDKAEDYKRTGSSKSMGDYGATDVDARPTSMRRDSAGGSMRRQSRSDPRFLKRMSSTATTDKVFERQSSKLSSDPSSKSLVSRGSRASRTRHTSVSRSEYHDDLKPQLRARPNRNLIFATFVVAFGESFLFGWNIGVLNQPSQLIKSFYNATYSERSGSPTDPDTVVLLFSLTNALFIPGGMCGAFLGGAVADRFGRKRGIMFSHIFTVIGAILSCACVAANSPELLMIGRVFVGINNGLGNCLAPMFLTEIAPYNLRGALGTIHQLSITLGIFFSSVFGLKELLGTPNLWPFLILLELGPALVACTCLPFLPETPRYLLLCKGERANAEKALQFYRRDEDVVTELEEMDTEHIQQAKSKEDDSYGVREFFRDRSLIKPLLVACMLQVVQQFSGINAVFFYSSTIFQEAGVSESQIPYTVIGTNAVNVAMTIITVPLIDISGRRPLLLYPMAAMIIDLIALTVALHFQAEHTWLAYVIIVCIILYVVGFAVGLGPIPMMIGSELFRQKPRPVAMAVAGVTNWVCTFIIALGFEPVQAKIGEYTFIIFLFIMITCLVLIFFLVPETKNKTFEEIAHQFSPGDDLEVEEVIEDDDDVFGEEPIPNEVGDAEDHQLVTINFDKKTDGSVKDEKLADGQV